MHFLRLFLIFFCVLNKCIANTLQHNALYYRYRCKYLSNSAIATKIAISENECAIYCSRDKQCLSVNYKTKGENHGLCELNNMGLSDFEAGTNSVRNDEFNYLQILNRQPPISCKDILTKSPEAKNGLYKISVNNQMVTVYCDMVLYGGGFTFIPKSAVKIGTLPDLVPQLFTNKSEVLLFIQKKDGSQTFTHIQQLKKKSQTPLIILQNTNEGPNRIYDQPVNLFMGDYLYLSTSIYVNGFLSNNIEVKYNYNNFPVRSYFAFFPNHAEQTPNTDKASGLVWETKGVAVDWRNTGKVSTERIPSNFFYLTEVHYGGSGCYTSSDRWKKANGTAIGLR